MIIDIFSAAKSDVGCTNLDSCVTIYTCQVASLAYWWMFFSFSRLVVVLDKFQGLEKSVGDDPILIQMFRWHS